MRLLHYDASPGGGVDSDNLAVAKAFLEGAAATTPGLEVEEIDLFAGTLPQFGTLAAGAKMAVFGGGQPTPEQTAEWDAARTAFERFDSGEAYLFSIPMWNAGVPNVLKRGSTSSPSPGGSSASRRPTATPPGVPRQFGMDFHSTFFGDCAVQEAGRAF